MNNLSDQTELKFPDERVHGAQVYPGPLNGDCVSENPPVLVWLPVSSKPTDSLYHCTVTDSSQNVVFHCETPDTCAIPDCLLEPGEYYWDVTIPELGISRGKMQFTVTYHAIPFLRPTADEIFDALTKERPRHLFSAKDIPALIANHPLEIETLRRNIQQAYKDGLPKRPMFHVDESALPYREYFGEFRNYCDRNLVACALGYALLGDLEAGQFAKKLFLHICDWNPSGPCSLCGSMDEVGLSCARCFPAVYDMLYPLLSAQQRLYAGETLAAYALQCEKRINAIDYAKNPGDSHVGRLPAYLGEAAITLWKEDVLPEYILRRWLEKALHIYGGMFPHYGGDDGSWAEGTFYSTSYTKWYLPFFSAVARFSGKNFLSRPFYRNYARFLLHFALPNHEIHPFGDGYWVTPESLEWPGFFAQNPFRVYAQLSNLPEAYAYDQELAAPELFALHLLDIFLPPMKIEDGYRTMPVTDADAFHDAGFVSLHSNHANAETDLHLIARASKYGPGSHRQPDQGSFAIFYGGTALVSPSGYFGRGYGTRHHMEWYNTTKAHNAILVDGIGQDFRNYKHTASIVSCGIEQEQRVAVLDISPSYPMLKSWLRTFRIVDQKTIIIEDLITADHPVTITYPMHMLSKPEEIDGKITVTRDNKTLLIMPEEGNFERYTFSDKYDVDLNEGQPEEYHVTQPQQYHIYFETAAKTKHHLSVTMTIS